MWTFVDNCPFFWKPRPVNPKLRVRPSADDITRLYACPALIASRGLTHS